MGQAFLVAAIAGLASAMLSGVFAPGNPLFMLFVFLAPLPLFLAGLGWHSYVAALGGLLASLLINIGLGTRPSVAFFGTVAAPVFGLVWYAEALFLRLDGGPAQRGIHLGRLAIAALFWVALFVIFTTLWVMPDHAILTERFRVMMSEMIAQITAGSPSKPSPEQQREIAGIFAELFLPISGVIIVVALTISGTLGLQIAERAGRLGWVRPDFRSFRLPGGALILFVLALMATMLSGYARAFAEIILMGLALFYMLQGLAVLHVWLAESSAKTPLLILAWLASALIPPVILVFTAIGMADHILDFRRPKAGPPQS